LTLKSQKLRAENPICDKIKPTDVLTVGQLHACHRYFENDTMKIIEVVV